MRFAYTSGFANFKNATKTYIRSTPKRRFFFHLQMWGLLVAGLLLAMLYSLYSGAINEPVRLVAILVSSGLIGGGAVTPLLRPWQMERIYKSLNGDPKKPIQVYLEIEGSLLISGIEGRSEGRFQRSAICDTAEDGKILLLFVGKKRFIYIPKAQLPNEAIEQIHSWLRLPGGAESC